MEFSKRLDLFGDEIFAALNERKVALEAQGRTIYNLSVGTPDFAPAEHIRKAMMDAAADPQNWKYSLRDLPELLDAVCGYYKRRFGVEIAPDQVASCAGSQEGVGHIGMVLCDEGDTVLLPTPCYPVFIAGSLLGGAKPWYYPLTKHRFGDCNVHQRCDLIPGIFFADGVIHHPFFDIVAHHRRGQLHPAETTEVAVDKLHRLIQIQPYRGEIVVPGQGKARSTRRNAEFGFSFHSILFRSCSCTFYKQERCFCAKAGETLSVKALLPVK